MSLSARVLGFLFAFLLVFFVSKTSFAQTNSNTQQYQAPNTNSDVPKNLHFWTQNVMLEVMSAMICQLAGVDPINPNQQCLGIDKETGKIGFVENGGGAIGLMGNLIAGTLLVPVHFSDYATYALNNFGFPKQSYAQTTGIGYTGLQPIVGLFTIFRNMAYLLMVFVFVLIGVAIMLRVRIDPRTVMTIQNQIPKLVIGVVMITFSYAIVGLLIDAMWVGTYFVINMVVPAEQKTDITKSLTLSPPGFVQNVFTGEDGVTGIVGLAGSSANSVGDVVSNIFESSKIKSSLSGDCSQDKTACTADNLSGGFFGDLIMSIIGGIFGFIAGIIAFFIFLIAIVVQLFKLWFALLKSFISIILHTILAPFWILGGLLPGAGQSIGIGPWLREITANLVVFPAIVFLFLIARVILDGFIGQTEQTSFSPPLIGNPSDTNAQIFGALIAVGFILSAPGIVESIKKMFKTSGLPGLGGIGEGQAIVGGAIGGGLSRTFRTHVNPNTGEKIAVGSGARFIERRVKLPIARKILGFGAEKQADIVRNSGTPTGIRPKNIRNRQGGSTPPPAPPTQNTP